ncbi:P-loop containing nucleoside triphosphate hydrolase protein [Flammula alnicola]|nr:P-loop containing nucleoside triphosphate hydrolase protein [Flammula alnicola]
MGLVRRNLLPCKSKWPGFQSVVESMPYVWRMIKDIASIPVEFLASIVPAIALSYSGQLLTIVQTAVDHRTVDPHLLISSSPQRISSPLHLRIKLHYSVHIFAAMVRLDRQLEQSFPRRSHSNIAFSAVSTALHVITTTIQLASQLSVLINVLRNQPDGPLLAILCFTLAFFQWSKAHKSFISDGVWAATTSDQDYIKSEGLKRAVNNPIHRKEIVAGGIAPFLLAQYREAVARISDRAGDFYEAINSDARSREGLSSSILLQELLRGLPEVVFTLRATTQSFTYTALSLVDETGSITERLAAVRQLYQVAKIPNRIKTLEWGISVEFRNVSFKYPGSDAYALRNTNFKIERGQLCVIVGNNGSGKSTILKLIARYLRRAISVLFQDYSLFPLSVRFTLIYHCSTPNLTHFLMRTDPRQHRPRRPPHASDLAKIQQAAQLGGADAFIERLPEQYDTYLERPVQDYYSALPEAPQLVWPAVSYGRVRAAGGIASASDGGGVGNKGLSGGQMQRIALSRTFMRSVVSDQSPSASLDPTAEHGKSALYFLRAYVVYSFFARSDLFERLRKLRGNKTMIFSSHRFGNLTRHADLILQVHGRLGGGEEGTHDQLIQHNGEYARIWMLQARAFL